MSNTEAEKFFVYVAHADNWWWRAIRCGEHDSEEGAVAAAVSYAEYHAKNWLTVGVPPLVVSTSQHGPECWRMEFYAVPAATEEELDAMESFCDGESTCDVHMLGPAAKTRAEIVRGFIGRHRT